MRLIDADSIPWDVDGVGEIPVITKEEINAMPTVDAVPVIRCKDCKWYDMTDAGGTFEPIVYRCRRVSRLWREPHDFCSRAEKIED